MADSGELMRRVARDRDREAFALLFRDFAPRLKGFFLRMVVDPVRADELVQETMLVVWRRADAYDPARAALSTWVFTIARNLRIDVLRKERRPEVEWDDPVLVPSAEDAVDAARRAEQVRQALAELPSDQADAVRRAYFDDASLSAVAAESDVPLGTVKSRIRLALRRLRAVLEPA